MIFALTFEVAANGAYFHLGKIDRALLFRARFGFRWCRRAAVGRIRLEAVIQAAGIQSTGKIIGQFIALHAASTASNRCDHQQIQEEHYSRPILAREA